MTASNVGRPRAKRQQVCENLQTMILGGQYLPGARLIQQDLAAELNSSVSVVREALLELVGVGLVDCVDQTGFFVGELNINRLTDTYRVRAVHQGLAARLCCERASRKDLRELGEMVDGIHELYGSDGNGDLNDALLLDRQMHDRLVEIAQNEVLTRACQSMWVPIVAADGQQREARHEDTHREHEAILRALEEGCPDEADRLAREHILNALSVVRAQLEMGHAELRWSL